MEQKIVEMSQLEHVRTHPNLYISNTENPNHLMTEIFANALDLATSGFCDRIKVFIGEKGKADESRCIVRDYGTGFKITNKKTSQMLLASTRLNSSGKFDDGFYKSALGTNGQGLAVSNWLSFLFKITNYYNGRCETAIWQCGELLEYNIQDTDEPNGVMVDWIPDDDIFDDPQTDIDYFDKLFYEICCLCPNLTVILNNKEIHCPDGIVELLNSETNRENELVTHQRFIINTDDFAMGLTYTSNDSAKIKAFVNYGKIDSGVPITRIKTVITRLLNQFAREHKLLKDSDKGISGSSFEEGMVLVFNVIAHNVGYSGQSKHSCTKIDMARQLENLTQTFQVWMDMYPDDVENIINKAILARKAAEAAKRARAQVKAGKRVANKVKILHPDKLKDAEYLGEDSTLLVVEGLSAGSSIAMARDSSKYGILMLRGKLINAFTNNQDRLMKNEELQLLFKALNQEPYHYDSSQLRYGKIGICVDSDSDGFSIAMLIATAIEEFFPEMIQEGRLCWLKSPLYIVKSGKKETYYYTDDDLDAAKGRGEVKGTIQRNKGLGSLSPQQAHDSMFTDRQRMEVITPTDNAIDLLHNLMGKDVDFRRTYIFNNVDFSKVAE